MRDEMHTLLTFLSMAGAAAATVGPFLLTVWRSA